MGNPPPDEKKKGTERTTDTTSGKDRDSRGPEIFFLNRPRRSPESGTPISWLRMYKTAIDPTVRARKYPKGWLYKIPRVRAVMLKKARRPPIKPLNTHRIALYPQNSPYSRVAKKEKKPRPCPERTRLSHASARDRRLTFKRIISVRVPRTLTVRPNIKKRRRFGPSGPPTFEANKKPRERRSPKRGRNQFPSARRIIPSTTGGTTAIPRAPKT
jgi:hypothetical protein